MELRFTYIDDQNGNKVSQAGDVGGFIADYYGDACCFGANECIVTECVLDGKNILPESGWDIEGMMEEIERLHRIAMGDGEACLEVQAG